MANQILYYVKKRIVLNTPLRPLNNATPWVIAAYEEAPFVFEGLVGSYTMTGYPEVKVGFGREIPANFLGTTDSASIIGGQVEVPGFS